MAAASTLILGGTQFNGLALTDELVSAGHRVTVLNRGRIRADLHPSVERLVCDRTDYERLKETLGTREFDFVCDVSGYRVEDLRATTRLLRQQTGHYLFVSSTQIYAPAEVLPIDETYPLDVSDQQNEYGRQKIACEEHLLELFATVAFPATIVAISMVFGPHNIVPDREQRMFMRLLRGRPVLVPGDGATLGQVGYVSDQAEGMRLMLGNPTTFGKRYNLSGHQYFSRNAYVDAFSEVLGIRAKKIYVPFDVMDAAWDRDIDLLGPATDGQANDRATALTRQRYLLSHLVQHVSPNLHRWNKSVLFSIERVCREIDWSPRLTLEQMIDRTYKWFVSTGLDRSSRFDFGFEDALLGHLTRS